MYITRRERFSSAHKLYNHQLNDDDNYKLFGKCSTMHGHNYELYVTITGNLNPKTGFIIDLKNLKNIIQNKILKKIDHNDINEVDFMRGQITSTENLCIAIWKELQEPIEKIGAKLYKIKLQETENNSFEYLGK